MGQVPTGIRYRAVLVSSIIALSGCGGGGGGGGGDGSGPMGNQPSNNTGNPSTGSNNPTPTTNAAGVAVMANKPDKGAVGINEEDAITVTFNTDIDPATLSTTTFIVRDEMSHQRIPGTVSYDPATKTATFKPQTPLNLNGHYLVSLTQGIKNTAGAALATDYTWDFEVRGQPISQTVSLYPSNDLTNVSVKSIVRIDFPEAMDASTINASTFSLAPDNGPAVEGAVSTSDQPFHPGGQISLFRPKAELAANTRYTAKLTQEVKTLLGVPINQELAWSFSTAAARTATIQYGTSMEDIANAVALDNDGNTFVVGSTDKVVAIVPDPDTPPVGVDVDMLLLSFDANGNKRWHKQPGSDAPDFAIKGLVDGNGDVIIVGSTDGQLGTDAAAGNSDIVIMKVSGATGETVWTRQFGSSEHDVPDDAIIDSTGNILITGFTLGALPGQTAVGQHDVLAVKLAADGAPVWGVQFGSTNDDVGVAIALDDKNNLFITGTTSGSFSGQQLKGPQDAFLARLDADTGKLATTQFIDFNNRDEHATSLAINSAGIFVGGNTAAVMEGGGTPTPGSELGDQNPFISAFNLAGDKSLWTRQWETAAVDSIENLTTDFSRDLYVTGVIVEQAPNPPSSGGPGTPSNPPGTPTPTTPPGGGTGGGMMPPPGGSIGGVGGGGGSTGGGYIITTNAFIGKVSSADGKDIWTQKLNAAEHGHIMARALTTDNKGNVLLGGTVHGDMGVDGNVSAGAGDVFVVKYNAETGEKL